MHGLDFHHYKMPQEVPAIVTLHLPIAWYPREVWARWNDRARFCCVSESQRRTCPPELHDAIVIENGVTVPQRSAQTPRNNFALVLGRVCPEKNAHEALEAGTCAGVPVILAGHVFPYRAHRQYFEEKIAPLLGAGDCDHRFLGSVGPEQRQQLLGEAKCLLHPTRAPETSSLVAMEALAAGTPVIAYRSGALSEIVEDGRTGYLVNNVAEMAAAIVAANRISPQACRDAALHRFDKRRMIWQYLELYASIIGEARPKALHV